MIEAVAAFGDGQKVAEKLSLFQDDVDDYEALHERERLNDAAKRYNIDKENEWEAFHRQNGNLDFEEYEPPDRKPTFKSATSLIRRKDVEAGKRYLIAIGQSELAEELDGYIGTAANDCTFKKWEEPGVQQGKAAAPAGAQNLEEEPEDVGNMDIDSAEEEVVVRDRRRGGLSDAVEAMSINEASVAEDREDEEPPEYVPRFNLQAAIRAAAVASPGQALAAFDALEQYAAPGVEGNVRPLAQPPRRRKLQRGRRSTAQRPQPPNRENEDDGREAFAVPPVAGSPQKTQTAQTVPARTPPRRVPEVAREMSSTAGRSISRPDDEPKAGSFNSSPATYASPAPGSRGPRVARVSRPGLNPNRQLSTSYQDSAARSPFRPGRAWANSPTPKSATPTTGSKEYFVKEPSLPVSSPRLFDEGGKTVRDTPPTSQEVQKIFELQKKEAIVKKATGLSESTPATPGPLLPPPATPAAEQRQSSPCGGGFMTWFERPARVDEASKVSQWQDQANNAHMLGMLPPPRPAHLEHFLPSADVPLPFEKPFQVTQRTRYADRAPTEPEVQEVVQWQDEVNRLYKLWSTGEYGPARPPHLERFLPFADALLPYEKPYPIQTLFGKKAAQKKAPRKRKLKQPAPTLPKVTNTQSGNQVSFNGHRSYPQPAILGQAPTQSPYLSSYGQTLLQSGISLRGGEYQTAQAGQQMQQPLPVYTPSYLQAPAGQSQQQYGHTPCCHQPASQPESTISQLSSFQASGHLPTGPSEPESILSQLSFFQAPAYVQPPASQPEPIISQLSSFQTPRYVHTPATQQEPMMPSNNGTPKYQHPLSATMLAKSVSSTNPFTPQASSDVLNQSNPIGLGLCFSPSVIPSQPESGASTPQQPSHWGGNKPSQTHQTQQVQQPPQKPPVKKPRKRQTKEALTPAPADAGKGSVSPQKVDAANNMAGALKPKSTCKPQAKSAQSGPALSFPATPQLPNHMAQPNALQRAHSIGNSTTTNQQLAGQQSLAFSPYNNTFAANPTATFEATVAQFDRPVPKNGSRNQYTAARSNSRSQSPAKVEAAPQTPNLLNAGAAPQSTGEAQAPNPFRQHQTFQSPMGDTGASSPAHYVTPSQQLQQEQQQFQQDQQPLASQMIDNGASTSTYNGASIQQQNQTFESSAINNGGPSSSYNPLPMQQQQMFDTPMTDNPAPSWAYNVSSTQQQIQSPMISNLATSLAHNAPLTQDQLDALKALVAKNDVPSLSYYGQPMQQQEQQMLDTPMIDNPAPSSAYNASSTQPQYQNLDTPLINNGNPYPAHNAPLAQQQHQTLLTPMMKNATLSPAYDAPLPQEQEQRQQPEYKHPQQPPAKKMKMSPKKMKMAHQTPSRERAFGNGSQYISSPAQSQPMPGTMPETPGASDRSSTIQTPQTQPQVQNGGGMGLLVASDNSAFAQVMKNAGVPIPQKTMQTGGGLRKKQPKVQTPQMSGGMGSGRAGGAAAPLGPATPSGGHPADALMEGFTPRPKTGPGSKGGRGPAKNSRKKKE